MGTKELLPSGVTHGPHRAQTRGRGVLWAQLPLHPTFAGVPFTRLALQRQEHNPAYSASHGQLNSSLAYSQMVSLTMNLDVRWRRPRSKLTLIKSSQPTLHNMVISKFGQASHTARLAQQGMSQSTKGDPDRRRFQFEMSLWEG